MSKGFTVRYMRKGLDHMPVDQWFPDKPSAMAEFERLAKAYADDDIHGLSLLQILDGAATGIATEDRTGI